MIGGVFTLAATVLTIAFNGEPDPPPRTAAPQVPMPDPSRTTEPDAVTTLLGLLPTDSVSSCTPIQPPVGALAKVQCAGTPRTGQVSVAFTFTLYDGLATSRRAFDEVVPAVIRESERACPDGPDRSDYLLPGQARPAGLLACWVADNNAPYVVWSRDDPGVLATAAGPVGGTLEQVWTAWLNTPLTDKGTTIGSPAPTSSPS